MNRVLFCRKLDATIHAADKEASRVQKQESRARKTSDTKPLNKCSMHDLERRLLDLERPVDQYHEVIHRLELLRHKQAKQDRRQELIEDGQLMLLSHDSGDSESSSVEEDAFDSQPNAVALRKVLLEHNYSWRFLRKKSLLELIAIKHREDVLLPERNTTKRRCSKRCVPKQGLMWSVRKK